MWSFVAHQLEQLGFFLRVVFSPTLFGIDQVKLFSQRYLTSTLDLISIDQKPIFPSVSLDFEVIASQQIHNVGHHEVTDHV